MKKDRFKPKIIGFLCNWCSYVGADMAGISRLQYPPDLIPIRVMCNGRLDVDFILRAFSKGADGVFVGGCYAGSCHYISGNLNYKRRHVLLRGFLNQMGINPERLCLEWVSATEGEKFARVITEFVRKIKEFGPISIIS